MKTRLSGKKVKVLESKALTLESDHNSLQQCGRHKNIEITGIPDSLSDQNLEEKVEYILNEISAEYHQKMLKRIIV